MKSFVVSTQNIIVFRERLLLWYRKHGRALPWRTTHDPYAILISEVMLQQTQVDRVIERYQRWLKRFPTVQVLAKAPTSTVLQEWSGLGYNRRALALQNIAKQVVAEHAGKFPKTVEGLMRFKGIGRYTASAIAAFAYRQPVPIVDTNVKRVLGRIYFGYKELAKIIAGKKNTGGNQDEVFWVLKTKIVPPNKTSYDFNQGIMDFGALICTAKQPRCQACPMQSMCKSYPDILQATPDQLRVKRQRREPVYFGQPRRIWRGKILQYLHTQTKPVSLEKIGEHIQIDWLDSRTEWLQSTLETMGKDNLIFINKKSKTWKVGLPKG